MTTPIERYYAAHAAIYDATRWSFLFGRAELMGLIAQRIRPRRILEIGCGTGANLQRLARAFPEAAVCGLDISKAMLDKAAKKTSPFGERVQLLHRACAGPVCADCGEEPFDVVVFSYALSMFNPGWREAIDYGLADLAPGGLVAAVDFHDTRFGFFRRWMALNHVRMEGHLLPQLAGSFEPLVAEQRQAYGGLWRYFLFVGKRRA